MDATSNSIKRLECASYNGFLAEARRVCVSV
jgi:hypothetical protein